MFEDRDLVETTGRELRHSTITEKLRAEKRALEFRLQEVNHVLEQLTQNPGVQQIIDSLAKLGSLRGGSF